MVRCLSGRGRHIGRPFAGLALALAQSAVAQVEPALPEVADPARFQCIGRNQFSGAVTAAVEKQDETGSWPYAVFLIAPVLGTPTIVYGQRFRVLDPLMRAFIRRHECQHANGVRDEIAANCAALVQMRALGLTPQQEAVIARWHLAEGRLDPQYGGSGAAFWERTVRCAAAVR